MQEKRTDDLFGVVREDSIYERPVPERHRIIFYLGHLEAFDWNLLGERAFGLQPFHQTFDKLFALESILSGADCPPTSQRIGRSARISSGIGCAFAAPWIVRSPRH